MPVIRRGERDHPAVMRWHGAGLHEIVALLRLWSMEMNDCGVGIGAPIRLPVEFGRERAPSRPEERGANAGSPEVAAIRALIPVVIDERGQLLVDELREASIVLPER